MPRGSARDDAVLERRRRQALDRKLPIEALNSSIELITFQTQVQTKALSCETSIVKELQGILVSNLLQRLGICIHRQVLRVQLDIRCRTLSCHQGNKRRLFGLITRRFCLNSSFRTGMYVNACRSGIQNSLLGFRVDRTGRQPSISFLTLRENPPSL